MKVLFDEGVPLPLRGVLTATQIDTVQSIGMTGATDAEILRRAERDGYDLLVTTDKHIKHQQNTTGLRVKIYELPTPSWPRLKVQVAKINNEIAVLFSGRSDTDLLNPDE